MSLLNFRDEDRDKMELLKSSSSDESMRRRASSSNDSILSSGASSAQHSPLTGIGTGTWPDPELTRRGLVTSEPTPLIVVPSSQEVLETTV